MMQFSYHFAAQGEHHSRGTVNSSTTMVMRMAMTPSLCASMRPLLILVLHAKSVLTQPNA
jgi:hypothetical protein